jgi:hypothetical protein
MQNQTREILRRLNAGKKATHIATELGVPPYVVYNAKHRYRRELKSRKVAVTSDGTKPLAQRVFEFIQANPDLRACEYGEAFAAVGEKKHSVAGTITHLVNAGLVERNVRTKAVKAVAKQYRPMQQTLTHKYKQTAYKPDEKVGGLTLDVEPSDLGQSVYFPPTMRPVSLWSRIKAVFTGHYV